MSTGPVPALVLAPVAEGAVEAALGPEARLRALFRHEADLQRQLAEARRRLSDARRLYGRKHNLLMLPSLDTLRRLFS